MDKNNRGMIIAGGVLELVAGALWLLSALLTDSFADAVGYNLDSVLIIMPLMIVIFGISAIAKGGKFAGIVYTCFNTAIIIMKFSGYKIGQIGFVDLGMIQVVLLIIASILFVLAPIGND